MVVVGFSGRGPPRVSRSISPYAWKARVVRTMSTNSSVGPSSGTVMLQNWRMPPAPSTAAASWTSRGMPCSPAVTSRNVKPRLAQTLDAATDASAVPGSRSSPGDLTTGKMSANHSTLANAPTSGCKRNNHIRLATATEVATVDVKMNRNTASPRRYLSASTASPTPRISPVGTVSRANFVVTQRACWNSSLLATSTYWSQPFEVQFRPWASQRVWPSHTACTNG